MRCWVRTGEETGSDGDDFEVGVEFLEPFAAAGDGAASADAADEDVDLAVGVTPDFLAVVARWIAGLAGFLNCCGMKALGFPWTISSARRTAPGIPSDAGSGRSRLQTP